MSDVLRQIDEDLRKEKLLSLWRSYGTYLIILVILGVGSLIGYQVYNSSNISNHEQVLENYIYATNMEEIDEKIEKLSNLEINNNEFITTLSKLRMANYLIQNSKFDEGISQLNQIIVDEKNDETIRDLALYFFILAQIDILDEDTFNSYLNENKMKDGTFKFLFKELYGIKQLLNMNTEAAKNIFTEIINNPEVPEEIFQRASKYLTLI